MKNIQFFFLVLNVLIITSCKGSGIPIDTETDINIEISTGSTVNIKIWNFRIDKDTTLLNFPKTLLGTYHFIKNKVNDFTAFNSKGEKLNIKTIGNKFVIYGSGDLNSITYNVNCSDKTSINLVSSGVIVDKDLIVLNNNILFGDFIGENRNYKVEIKKGTNFNNISNQQVYHKNDSIDIIRFRDYKQMINSPIIYSRISTNDTFFIGSTKFVLSVHSPNSMVKASLLSTILKPVTSAIINKIGFVFKDNYNLTFIYDEGLNEKVYQKIALEHPNSSVYHFFSTPSFINKRDSINYYQDLQQMVAHELFHVFTPINFRDNFDDCFYNDTLKMSPHLWLYEGFVEYYSLKILLDAGIIDKDYFFSKLAEKIYNYSKYVKMGYKISLAEASENIYDKSNLNIFYDRAAVLCFLMDIEVAELSQGKYSLYSVIKQIYKQNNKFNKDSLFFKMNSIAPGIDNFANKYIISDKYPDLSFYLSKAGLSYTMIHKEFGYYFPIKIIAYNSKTQTITIEFQENISPFVKNKQIEITEINNYKVSSYSFSFLYRRYYNQEIAFEIKYIEKGVLQSATIKPILVNVPKIPYYPNIFINRNMNFSQKRIYEKLFEK
ncbi:MAG: hypothetical protein IMY72_08315 [Bacteroidetes bacterium]|nr:hypothetical protein [Bacteroidota bacterium]